MLAHIYHNGTDTFISDYYSDTNETTSSLTVDEIGQFAGDIVSGMVSFNYTSDTNNNVE